MDVSFDSAPGRQLAGHVESIGLVTDKQLQPAVVPSTLHAFVRQSAMVPIILPHERLKVGVEMQLTTFTDKGIRDDPSYRLIIGPSIGWKPTKNTRLDMSPLFGTTDDAPRASVFVVFSMLFGPGGEAHEAEAPASTRNR